MAKYAVTLDWIMTKTIVVDADSDTIAEELAQQEVEKELASPEGLQGQFAKQSLEVANVEEIE